MGSGHLANAAGQRAVCAGAERPSMLIGVPGIIVTHDMATFFNASTQRVALAAAT